MNFCVSFLNNIALKIVANNIKYVSLMATDGFFYLSILFIFIVICFVIVTYFFLYFFYFVLCINVVNLLSIKRTNKQKKQTKQNKKNRKEMEEAAVSQFGRDYYLKNHENKQYLATN